MEFYLHMNNLPTRILPILFFALLLGTHQSSAQPALPLTPYQGSWTFTFAGGLDGSGTMEVSAESKISVHVCLRKYESVAGNGTWSAQKK